jgi:hypothetical protein
MKVRGFLKALLLKQYPVFALIITAVVLSAACSSSFETDSKPVNMGSNIEDSAINSVSDGDRPPIPRELMSRFSVMIAHRGETAKQAVIRIMEKEIEEFEKSLEEMADREQPLKSTNQTLNYLIVPTSGRTTEFFVELPSAISLLLPQYAYDDPETLINGRTRNLITTVIAVCSIGESGPESESICVMPVDIEIAAVDDNGFGELTPTAIRSSAFSIERLASSPSESIHAMVDHAWEMSQTP